MDVVIREIEEKDYPAVTSLFSNEIMGKHDADSNYKEPVALFFDKVKNDDQYATFVALLDGSVVGFLSTAAIFWVSSTNLFIQCFAVQSEYQNKGIGKKLLGHAENYARAKGMTGAGLQSGVQRTAAHSFYEHNGYNRSNYFYKNF